MLCLDMKLVSRLRGTAAASATNTSPTTQSATSVVSPSLSSSTERNKSHKARRESGEAIPITTSDSEEELLRPGSSVQEMSRRSRSRSVCVTTILPSSQLRQLHRRASHVYVASDLRRLTMNKSTAESSNELLTPQLPIIRYFFRKG